MPSDKNSGRVDQKHAAERALDEALHSESGYDYGPVTDFSHLRTRMAARTESQLSEKRSIMGRMFNQINNMTRRSRLTMTAAVAVAALALFTLVPFTYQDTIGYEVAFAGVDKDLALDKTRLNEVLEQLGVEGAVVDVFGCEETCNMRITDLKSAFDAQLVSAALGESKNVRLLHVSEESPNGIKVLMELKSGSLLDKARNIFLASGSGDKQAASLIELHEIVLEKLGSDFNPDMALWVSEDGTSFDGDSLADFTGSVGKAMFFQSDTNGILGATWILQRSANGFDALDGEGAVNALSAFKITLAPGQDSSIEGAMIMCVGDSGNTFTCSIDDLSLLELQDGSLSDDDIERLRQKGYTVDVQERDDGTRVITMTR